MRNNIDNLKIPPQSIDTEISILGAMMLDKDAAETAMTILEPNDFYRSSHKIIFNAMVSLIKNNSEIDSLTLTEELNKNSALDNVGGSYYLAEIINGIVSSSKIEDHIKIVKNYSKLRRIIKECQIAQQRAYELNDPSDIIVDLDKNLFSELGDPGEVKHLNDFTQNVIDRWDYITETKYITGIESIDYLIRLHDGLNYVLAGKPGAGKTSFTINMIINNAKAGFPVGIFSQDMSGMMLNYRSGLTAGNVMTSGFYRYESGIKVLKDLPIYIDETARLLQKSIKAKIAKMIKKFGVKLIFVDYFQLALGEGQTKLEREENLSIEFKTLSKEFDICLILLSQMRKESFKLKRDISDVKGAGQLIQDARGIYFIEDNDQFDVSDFYCGKQSYGAGNWTVPMRFDKEYNFFSSINDSDLYKYENKTNQSKKF